MLHIWNLALCKISMACLNADLKLGWSKVRVERISVV